MIKVRRVTKESLKRTAKPSTRRSNAQRRAVKESTKRPMRRTLRTEKAIRARQLRTLREADGDTSILEFKVPAWMYEVPAGGEFTVRAQSPAGGMQSYDTYPDENSGRDSWYKGINEEAYEEASRSWNSEMNDSDIADCFGSDKVIRTYMEPNDYTSVIIGFEYEGEPSDAEIKKLQDALEGQMSDGWGEGFEQHPVYSGRSEFDAYCEMPAEWADEFIDNYIEEEDPDATYEEAESIAKDEWDAMNPIEVECESETYVKFYNFNSNTPIKFLGIR